MTLTPAERDLAATIGFDEEVCAKVKQFTGRPLDRLVEFTEEFDQQLGDGLSIAVEREHVERLASELQTVLMPFGYCAFWSEILEANGAKASEEIVVLKTTDPYSILRIRRTSGGNYGVSTESVIAKLEDWEQRCRFQILGAGGAWVAIRFESLPANICAFAEEVYNFCPDTVEQGVGLSSEKDNPEEFEAARRLCPELSESMQRELDEQKMRFRQISMPPELRELLSSDATFSTPTDMGIRLLAYYLRTTSELFLWWD